jgi:putative toxin-antitoxin system antitoxin component (TIGR02293 family)
MSFNPEFLPDVAALVLSIARLVEAFRLNSCSASGQLELGGNDSKFEDDCEPAAAAPLSEMTACQAEVKNSQSTFQPSPKRDYHPSLCEFQLRHISVSTETRMIPMATRAASIESILGVKPGATETRLALAHKILDGLPVSAVGTLAEIVAPDDGAFKYRLVPRATLERRKKTKRLTSEEGDRLARVAKVMSFAIEIYGDPAKAREFLSRPHAMLDGEKPLDVALATGPGADVVINLLGRAAYSAAT